MCLNKIMKIAIIGAGWFGCHIAYELIKRKYDVKVFEKEKDIFKNGSGNNTNRLHLGYHYPRSFKTRQMSKEGYKKFILNYPKFTNAIKYNIYSVASGKSNLMNSRKYEHALKKSKLKFNKINSKKTDLINIKSSFNTAERQIDHFKAKKFFKRKLKKNINFKTNIKKIEFLENKYKINNQKFDFVINCTWQQSFKSKNFDLTYEHCLVPLFKINKPEHKSYTIMDGPFYTLLNWNRNIFALYSVKNSRVATSKNLNYVKNSFKKISNKKKQLINKKIVNGFSFFYPDFEKNFKFFKNMSSIRTIIKNKKDARICIVKNENNFINILSGKIDHIFYAFNEVLKLIKKNK